MKRKNPKFIIRPDSGTLQLNYSQKGNWFRLNSHIKAVDSEWDEQSQVLRGDRKDDNLILQGMLHRIQDIIYQYRLKHSGKPSVEYMREQYYHKDSVDDILIWYDKFIVYKRTYVKNLSIYNANRTKLELFILSKKYKSIMDINTQFKEEFIRFYVGDNKQNITIRKRIKVLKEFISWVKLQGISVDETTEWGVKLQVERADTQIILITDKEFNVLLNKKFEKDKYDRARDIYLVGCTTGLRYSDLQRLSPELIKGNYIELVTQKTGTFCRIPMNEVCKSILEKYNYTLPKISDQKLNANLYKLFRELDIVDKVTLVQRRGNTKKMVTYDRSDCLSIHTARKYFITTCISKGITPDNIMQWTAQFSLKVFYDYVQKGLKGAEQMKNIFKLPTS